MVKTPKTRHSKPQREPVTIELEPGDVSRAPTAKQRLDAKTEIFDLVPPPGATADESAAIPPESAAGGSRAHVGRCSAGGSRQRTSRQTSGAARADADGPRRQPRSPMPAPGASTSPSRRRKCRYRSRWAMISSPDAAASRRPTRFAAPRSRRSRHRRRLPMPPPRARVSARLRRAVIGGAVALAGGGLLQFARRCSGAPGGRCAKRPRSSAVEAEIAALKTEIAALKEGGGGPADPEIAGRVDGARPGARPGQGRCRLAAGSDRRRGAGDNAGLQALDARVKQLETAIAGLGQRRQRSPPEELAALNARPRDRALSERIAGVEALVKSAGEADSAIDGRLGALEQSLAALSARSTRRPRSRRSRWPSPPRR